MRNLIVILIVIFTLHLSATIIHIPDDQPTIQAGLEQADEGDSVMVAEGIYYENIIWPETAEIKLFGNDTETTIIDANGNGSVIRFENYAVDTLTVVANFTIQNASENGIYCYSSNPKLSNLIIQNNSGGGVFCFNVSPIIMDNSIIRDNSSSLRGGGIRCNYTSNAVLLHCSINNNYSDLGGGGISAEGGSELELIYCVLNSNTATNGGAVYCGEKGSVDFINCTITENIAYETGGAIYTFGMSPSGVNSIIWNNEPNQIHGDAFFTYSDIQDFWEGEGNIDDDPLFADVTNEDYHLTENSPCIDAGDPNFPFDPDGTISDMGAFYFDQLSSINDNEIQFVDYHLSNFPNPFNPTTTIKFSIQNDSKITLTIYNIKGQKIKTITQNIFTKGSHSIIWNGDDEIGEFVSSGVYLYKLNVNDKTESVKKCLLLK